MIWEFPAVMISLSVGMIEEKFSVGRDGDFFAQASGDDSGQLSVGKTPEAGEGADGSGGDCFAIG